MQAKGPRRAGPFGAAADSTTRGRLILPNLPQRVYVLGVLVKLLVQNADIVKTSGR